MKVLKAMHNMFATGNVAEDIRFTVYLLAMSGVGLYVLSLTASAKIIIACVSMLSLLFVATIIFSLQQEED